MPLSGVLNEGKNFLDLSLEEWRSLIPQFDEEILENLNPPLLR